MTNLFPLHLFPTAGFDRSTTTPVLLGVLVSWFFCETFGWVFAGLVVPGYLAAVFAIDPRAGMVDVSEAILTYGLARGIGEHLARTGITSRVFGRERFLLIVLCSIIVRLFVEGALLPRIAPHAAQSFFSIGLVVVPLAANACWKTGLGRGIIQNGIPTIIVFLLLRFLFVPYTNLSLAGFELATEDVAGSFLASPKAYILLITGAILAAAANVLDGWDFNGILIPALLALVVVEPLKFGATFVEALAIVAVATMLLKTTPLGRWNIEGPRRLVLFFSIDYAMRFVFSALAGKTLPGGDVVALMGFGYLLPTLLAVKIAQRGSAPLVLLPTAQVSIGAFALGTLIGFSAAIVDTAPATARALVERPLPQSPNDPESAGLWVAALARNIGHEGKGPAPASPADLVSAVDNAVANKELGGKGPWAQQRLDRSVVLLRERFEHLEDRWGDPAVLVTASGRAAGRRVILLVDTPVTAPEAGALAGRLVADGRADAAVIAGIEGPEAGLFGRAALDGARALARRENEKKTDTELGVVVALRRGPAARLVLSSNGQSAARLDAMLVSLESKAGSIPRKTGEVGAGIDAVLELPDAAFEALFADDAKVSSIASPAAMATVLDAVRTSTGAASPEDLMVLRRLLLEPLLAPKGVARSLPLLRVHAAKLGYALHGPSPLGGGGEALILVPTQPSRPIALLAKADGVSGTVIEVPQGYNDGVRDVAVRLGASLSADAILFGLEHGGGARGSAALRLAHAISTTTSGTQATPRTPRVVLVREGAHGTPASVGSWGGAGRLELESAVKKAFAEIGLTAVDEPLDLAVRELSGRAVFGEVPLVAASIDGAALRTLSLDDARGAARLLAGAGLTTYDGNLVDVASKLAMSIPSNAAAAPSDLAELARRATIEQSVVARRALTTALDTTGSRAGLVRAKSGDFLLVVAKEASGWLAAATSTDSHAPREEKPVTKVKALRDCAAVLDAGGACRAEAL